MKDGVGCFVGFANGCREFGLLMRLLSKLMVASLEARVQFSHFSGVPSEMFRASRGSLGFMVLK